MNQDDPLKISSEWVQKLLTVPEFERQDFKRAGSVKSVFKTACAMANGDGGLIIFGVDDPKKGASEDRLQGIEERPEALGEVKRGFYDEIEPPLDAPETEPPEFLEFRIKKTSGDVVTVVLIVINKSNTVHSYNNATYVRSGSQSRQINAQQIHKLCLRRGVDSVVNQPVDVPVELLETEWWQQYAKKRELTRDPADAMKHLGLLVKDGKKWKPTMAAVLLFAEEPNGVLGRKCSIRIFHYQGHEVEYDSDTNLIRPPITISGPLLKQIRMAVETVSRELDAGMQRTKDGFDLKQKYPKKVIQEAITNAVLHRDYNTPGDIHVRIFTNRVEVESPGSFPGAVTAGNIGEVGSHPRNPKLTDHIREFPVPPNLDAGEGVRMMRSTMDRMGLYPPVFQEESKQRKEVVLVRISNEAKLDEWELVKDYLAEHDSIGNKDLRTILNLSASESHKASRFFKEWVDSGLLRIENPQEGTRNRRYVLASALELFAKPLAINGEESLISLIGKGLYNTLLAAESARRRELS